MNRKDITGLIKKIRYFGPFLPLSHLFTTFFGSKLPKKSIECIEYYRNKKIRKILLPYVDNCLNNPIPQYSNNSFNAVNPIWLFWLQGFNSLTPLSSLCIESIKKFANGHEVILLDKHNLSDYVKIPEIVIKRFEEGNIKTAHFADILRINILAQYGGLWLDATMLMTQNLPEKIFKAEFWSIKNIEFGNYVSRCRWSVFSIAAQKHNLLFIYLSSIFEDYFKKFPVMVDYFMFDQLINLLYEKSSEIKQMIEKVPYNNTEVHSLNSILNQDFDENEWKELISETYLFKLSNKTYQASFKFKENSYFNHIKKDFCK